MAIRNSMDVGSARALRGAARRRPSGVGSAKHEADDPMKVAVVTDIGGLNDKGFNALAYEGPEGAKRQYGVKGRVLISKSGRGLRPEPVTAGTPRVRPRHRRRLPDGRLDGDRREAVPGHEVRDHRRERGRHSRASRRTSAASSSPSRRQGASPASPLRRSKTGTISSVGGQADPAGRRYIAGYKYCAERRRSRASRTLNGLLQELRRSGEVQGDRAEPDRGRARMSSSRPPAAAASAPSRRRSEKGVWGIGVDTDQAFLGPLVLTSATKKVDLGVFTRRSRTSTKGTFKGGVDGLFTVKNGGVGFGKVSVKAPEPRHADRQAQRVLQADRDGQDQAADQVARRHRHHTAGGPRADRQLSDASERAGRRAGDLDLASAAARPPRTRTSSSTDSSRAKGDYDRADGRAARRPRDAAHHEALSGHRRQRRRELRPPRGRGPRPPR